jgi:nucleotide-binding universal stress UspA family protein
MSDLKTIVVLFDDLVVSREAIRYAIALAHRIEAGITLLMLLPNEMSASDGAPDVVRRGQELLDQEAERIAEASVGVRREVMMGEPRSEFIKFMATRPTFHTAVWGGDRKALLYGTNRQSDHWISTLRSELPCPLVVPAKK